MLERIDPTGIQAPIANYSHATLVPAAARWLFISGQVGVRPDGETPGSIEAQTEQAFENLMTILTAAGMSAEHLVRLNVYLTDAADRAAYMTVRDRYVGRPPPASTLVVVQALARPEFKVEVEAVAAAPAGHGT